MSHKSRVERHIVVDLIAATAAGSLVAAITTRSWVAAFLAFAAGVALLLIERHNIDEEDHAETTVLLPPPSPLSLSVANVRMLQRKAMHPAANNVPEEGLAYYIAGLEDGAAVQADWVLEQLEGAE